MPRPVLQGVAGRTDDFTIDELGVSLHISERASGRVDFEAPAGTYTVNCTLTGHERMEITLDVG